MVGHPHQWLAWVEFVLWEYLGSETHREVWTSVQLPSWPMGRGIGPGWGAAPAPWSRGLASSERPCLLAASGHCREVGRSFLTPALTCPDSLGGRKLGLRGGAASGPPLSLYVGAAETESPRRTAYGARREVPNRFSVIPLTRC